MTNAIFQIFFLRNIQSANKPTLFLSLNEKEQVGAIKTFKKEVLRQIRANVAVRTE